MLKAVEESIFFISGDVISQILSSVYAADSVFLQTLYTGSAINKGGCLRLYD